MFTTCPCLALRSSGRQARVIHIRPRTLTFHIPIQSSSTALSMVVRPSAPPALFTSTSMRPNLFLTSRTNAVMLCWSVTSSAIAMPSLPAARFRRSNRRAPTTIWKPRRPRATAVAAPMPDEAPVMTATGVVLFAALPPCTRRTLRLRCEFAGTIDFDGDTDAVKAYPREHAAGGHGGVCRRPPPAGRHRRHDGPEPRRNDPAPALNAPPRQRPVRVSEPAARGRSARFEHEDPACARGGGPPVHLVARAWSRRPVARAPRRRGPDDEQRAGRALRASDRAPETARPQPRGELTGALEGALERAADCRPGPFRAARASALPAPLSTSPGRQRIRSGSPFEKTVGFSRAVRVGNRVVGSGTAPIWPDGTVDPDPYIQAKRCLEIIETALREAGASPGQVIRTRMYLTDSRFADAVGKAHGEAFGETGPASTMVVVKGLLDERWKVEIEAEAQLD